MDERSIFYEMVAGSQTVASIGRVVGVGCAGFYAKKKPLRGCGVKK